MYYLYGQESPYLGYLFGMIDEKKNVNKVKLSPRFLEFYNFLLEIKLFYSYCCFCFGPFDNRALSCENVLEHVMTNTLNVEDVRHAVQL